MDFLILSSVYKSVVDVHFEFTPMLLSLPQSHRELEA